MNKEQLTIEHLAANLPYGLKVMYNNRIGMISTFYFPAGWKWGKPEHEAWFSTGMLSLEEDDPKSEMSCSVNLTQVKPILRPLSDLTKEEFKLKLKEIKYRTDSNGIESIISDVKNSVAEYEVMVMLFKNHFDVFGLIDKGLAIDINSLK